jgi:limonene-1,2-epoxide hydrolase
MSAPEVTQDARAVAMRFIDAFNDRDLERLRKLVTPDAEFRTMSGEVALRGPDGVTALIGAAQELELRVFPIGDGDSEEAGDRVRVTLPVREIIGPDDVERAAVFEVAGDRVAGFSVRSLD